MRYIFLILFFLYTTLGALEFSFDDLRTQERILALKEFKALYKKRKNIHYNMRQTLKHARSKNLHKNNLSFFQAKSFNYEEDHPMELRTVYLSSEVVCDGDCQNEDIDASTTIQEINSDIRGAVSSPWALR